MTKNVPKNLKQKVYHVFCKNYNIQKVYQVYCKNYNCKIYIVKITKCVPPSIDPSLILSVVTAERFGTPTVFQPSFLVASILSYDCLAQEFFQKEFRNAFFKFGVSRSTRKELAKKPVIFFAKLWITQQVPYEL
jgi:hypothetical protein